MADIGHKIAAHALQPLLTGDIRDQQQRSDCLIGIIAQCFNGGVHNGARRGWWLQQSVAALTIFIAGLQHCIYFWNTTEFLKQPSARGGWIKA